MCIQIKGRLHTPGVCRVCVDRVYIDESGDHYYYTRCV
ncbi:MAG: hypothetical protein UW22_C0006G0002 [Candidatus Gottesmanbacteria bacterium GW2011_GWB1_44_11c]|uniref:Uncharacterized protein n=1 Tax=Candidatus Gottesmanbacteria bacterium GW2011_GWB1_44_11c TaxID=1618447 RepID=A0A0G1GUI0_9BACT|nr:MAG: hypothetical protein UW22_C0006G0002 [Candidatus Gottesmanbacteria bacterium GW2011_GWB1_44_11c]